MLYRVDTVELDPANAEEYGHVVEGEMVPLMDEAGAVFEGCLRTARGLGGPVSVQTTWSCAGFEEWNVIRRNLVLDPRWYACAEHLNGLCLGGTRRFYQAMTKTPTS